jgi:tetratricopeptide (TPR) repeat protein
VTGEDMCLSFKACYAKNKDWDNAIKYFRKFLDKQSNCSSGLLANMAALYEGKSDYDKALEWYFKAKEKALEEKRSYMGTNDYAYQVYCITTYGMEIAEVYLKKGETHKAVELYRQLKGKIVDDPAGKKLRELGY